MPIHLWLIDDAEANHSVVRATLHGRPEFSFEGFHDGETAATEFAFRAAHAPERLPRVVLMDFYMGELRGDQTTERIRAVATPLSPIIIGYSSVASGSRAIVEAGGDLVLRKHAARDGTNPDLTVYLDSLLRLAG